MANTPPFGHSRFVQWFLGSLFPATKDGPGQGTLAAALAVNDGFWLPSLALATRPDTGAVREVVRANIEARPHTRVASASFPVRYI